MATQQEVIKQFMKALDGHTFKRSSFSSDTALTTKILDTAIKKCSGFSSAQAVINQMLADCESYNAADSKNGWENFLLEKCGINLDNRDTGAITGSDAGGSTAKTTESIVPEGSTSVNSFTGSSFVVKDLGLTIQLASFEDKFNPQEITYDDLTDDTQRYIWRALQTHWASGALNLIAQSYGNNFGFTSSSSATVKKIYFGFFNDENGDLATTPHVREDGVAYRIGIRVNMSYYSSLANGGNVNGKTTNYGNDGTDYLDRALAHEFTHAVMAANVNSAGDLPAFIQEGIPELTIGIDNFRTSSIKKLASNASLLAQALVMDADYPDVTGVSNPSYVGGFMFMRYLAKQASTQGKFLDNSTTGKKLTGGNYEDILKNSASNVTISGGKKNDYINNSGSNVSISGGDGADQIYTSGNKVTVTTGKDDDFVYLYSSASNAKVVTGSGNKEIHSAAQSATITTSSGNDYFMLYRNAVQNTISAGGGKDSIYTGAQTASINAGAGNDYIELYSSATKTTVRAGTGNDSIESYAAGVVYEYASGDGKDTISGFSALDTLKIIDASFSTTTSGNNISVKVGSGSVLLKNAKNITPTIIMSVTNASKSPVTVGSAVKIVDASARTKAINLTGNALANSIVGGSKNDSIWGGAGNDSIFGNAGNDKLYGEAGNDILSGESGNDSLRGGTGADSIWGGAGADKLYGDDGKDFLIGNEGNDSLWGGANDDKLWGSDGNDRLDGEAGNDSLYGGAGKDTIYGGTGKDLIQGNDGNDRLYGEAGNDKVYGGTGDDLLYGNEGNDLLSGNEDNDSLYGGANDDTIYGGVGNDMLTGGTGNDSLWGGDDDDEFIYAAGDGKDVIFGFEDGDTLTLDNLAFTSSYKNNIVSLTFNDGGSITLKDFSASTFHLITTRIKSAAPSSRSNNSYSNISIPSARRDFFAVVKDCRPC